MNTDNGNNRNNSQPCMSPPRRYPTYKNDNRNRNDILRFFYLHIAAVWDVL